MIFDKTGTMTVGRPEVTSIIPMKADVPAREVLQYAGAAEETSTHPMAAAIVEKVRRNGWQIPPANCFPVVTRQQICTPTNETKAMIAQQNGVRTSSGVAGDIRTG